MRHKNRRTLVVRLFFCWQYELRVKSGELGVRSWKLRIENGELRVERFNTEQ
jgi:hypothetical protein